MTDRKTDEFWLPIITNKQGELDRDAVLNELHDYSQLMDTMSELICHYSSEELSRPNYTTEVFKQMITRYYNGAE